MVHHAALAGAQNLEELQVSGKNTSRDFLRRAFKNTKWPPPYSFTVRAWNESKQMPEMKTVSVLLPHELLNAVLKVNNPAALLEAQAVLVQTRPDLQLHQQKLDSMGYKAEEILLMSIWADAVPFNSDRSQSLETISLAFLGQQDLRLPLAGFPKCFCRKGATYEDIFAVLQWSFKCLLSNRFPAARHDGAAFLANDGCGKKRQSQPIGLLAVLCELKADWAFYAETLAFPSWSSSGPICWLCSCERSQLKQFDDASLALLLGYPGIYLLGLLKFVKLRFR